MAWVVRSRPALLRSWREHRRLGLFGVACGCTVWNRDGGRGSDGFAIGFQGIG